jgi:hypothetical protein
MSSFVSSLRSFVVSRLMLSRLIYRNSIIITDCYDGVTPCTDKCLPSSCRNRGGKVNIGLNIDWSNLTPKPPTSYYSA